MTNQAIMIRSYGKENFFPVSSFSTLISTFNAFIILIKNVLGSTSLDFLQSDENVRDMLEFQNGDQQAFLKIYNRNKRKVYAWTFRMVKNEATAEEISQEVFIRIFKLQKTYEPKSKFTTLLYTITSRLVFNESRRKSRHPEDEMDIELFQNLPDISSESIKMMENKENKEILERAIQKIPERQRAGLMLRYHEEMNHEEISQVMEISIQAVKSMLHRGLISLSEILKEEGVLQ